MKVTKANVYAVFILLANQLGKRVYMDSCLKGLIKKDAFSVRPNLISEKYSEEGAWTLSRGKFWEIHEFMNSSGAIGQPMGYNARTSSEFYDACHFSLNAIRILKASK